MLIDNERAILFRSREEHDDFERWLAGTPWGVPPEHARVRVDWPKVYCLFCACARREAEGRALPDGCDPFSFLQRLSWGDLLPGDRQAFRLASVYGAYGARDMDRLAALARDGQPVALRVLARCHRDGLGVPRNPEAAFRCLRSAYELGATDAACDLALALLEGRGTRRDPVLAAELLHEAVVGTTGPGCEEVGAALMDGRFGFTDLPLAELHLRRAAAMGMGRAAELLAGGMAAGLFPDAGDMDDLLALAGPDSAVKSYRVGRHLVEAALSRAARDVLSGRGPDCGPAMTARHLIEITQARAPKDVYALGMEAVGQAVAACPAAARYYRDHMAVTLSDGTKATAPAPEGAAAAADASLDAALERLPLRSEADRAAFVEFVEASPYHPGMGMCREEDVDWVRVFLLWRANQRRAMEERAITPDQMFGYLLRRFRHDPSPEDTFCDELTARWDRGEVSQVMRDLLRLAERGHPKALFYIAHCFDEGLGLGRDPAAARTCLVDAYESGYSPAALSLAVSLLEEADDERARVLAAIHFEEAVLAGDPENFGRVGVALMNGTFGRADRWDGELNLRRGAALGDPMACCYLARGMREGKIPPAGDSHALLKTAADRGHDRGLYLLALDFLDAAVDGDLSRLTSLEPGEPRGPADLFDRAAELLRAAARAGNEEALRLMAGGRGFSLSDGTAAALPRMDTPPRQ